VNTKAVYERARNVSDWRWRMRLDTFCLSRLAD